MKLNRFAWLAVGVGVSGCASSLNVQTDYDRQANFRQYDSFAVLPDPKYNNDPVLGSELNRRQEVQSTNNFTPYWWYFYGPRVNSFTRNYEEDRIIVNVRDARADRMIWQGYTSGQILTTRTKDPEQALYKAVAGVMRQFPDRGGTNTGATSQR